MISNKYIKDNKSKSIIIVLGIVILIYIFSRIIINSAQPTTNYQLAEIKYGNVENIVSSTGTINPVTIVEVGTQVSGIVDKVLVDFNDDVKIGQILAILDTVNLALQVEDAQSNLDKTKAIFEQAKYDYEIANDLYKNGLYSELEIRSKETEKDIAYANYKSALTSYKKAKTNLKYALIVSPIDGKILHRNIEPGQTIAASFSTPMLFLIAEDLTQIEIHASVDESDIGLISEGQEVRFSVQSFPDKEFVGFVQQIRLQPSTVSNVVLYTVIIEAKNLNEELLPGMTALVDFVVESANDVLLVPNAALRFQPMTDVAIDNANKNRTRNGSKRNSADNNINMSQTGNRDIVWLLTEEGELYSERIIAGITDGKMTQIVSSKNINSNTEVIVGNVIDIQTESKNDNSVNRAMSRAF